MTIPVRPSPVHVLTMRRATSIQPEMERLILIHEIITRSIGGLYLAPIDSDKTKRILDVGTGSGICKLPRIPAPIKVPNNPRDNNHGRRVPERRGKDPHLPEMPEHTSRAPGILLTTLQVIGNDLSANMPTFVPTNVKFEVDDVESDWLHEEKFSFIFSRYMAASIVDWPRFVNNIHEFVPPILFFPPATASSLPLAKVPETPTSRYSQTVGT